MDIGQMMQQAQQMQTKMQELQAELSEKNVEATVGGGKVTVTATAGGDVIGIKLDPDVVDPDDVEMLEDLLVSGVKQALEKGKQVQAEEMSKLTGGLGLPPGLGL